MTYPIAETFHSIQGEGVWTGTPMFFVRLAGCNVGEYLAGDGSAETIPGGMGGLGIDFHLYQEKQHSMCTTVFGERFLCDTDYHRSSQAQPAELARQCTEHHVCITGGEPFMYDLSELCSALEPKVDTVHVETSGTKPIRKRNFMWITCSPKRGFIREMIPLVDEWKFVAGPGFRVEMIEKFFEGRAGWRERNRIFLQPMNGVDEVDRESQARAVMIVQANPWLRLSAQLHKYLGAR